MGFSQQRGRMLALLGLSASLALGFGCASQGPHGAYDYFARPDPGEPWSRKIQEWQVRQREANRDGGEPERGARVPGPVGERPQRLRELAEAEPVLSEKYEAFRAERKRQLAREVAEWIQRQSGQHYVEDGAVDHWATLQETLGADGDDCDGLELLTYNFLLDLGFTREEVFRAVVFRQSDGQHHMVTLWFEDPGDPWVIDPTGAMTFGMPHMSEVPEWAPLKVFSEDRDYTVRPASLVSSHR